MTKNRELQPVDLNIFRDGELSKRSGSGGSSKFAMFLRIIPPKNGSKRKYRVRPLPSVNPDNPSPIIKDPIHYFYVGGRNHGGVCPKEFGINCPAHELYWTLREVIENQDDDSIKKVLRKLNATTKYYCNVIHRKDEGDEVKVWSISYTNYLSLEEEINRLIDPNELGELPPGEQAAKIQALQASGEWINPINPFDLETGVDITFTVHKEHGFTKYSEPRAVSRPTPAGLTSLNELHDLRKASRLTCYSPKEVYDWVVKFLKPDLAKAFFGAYSKLKGVSLLDFTTAAQADWDSIKGASSLSVPTQTITSPPVDVPITNSSTILTPQNNPVTITGAQLLEPPIVASDLSALSSVNSEANLQIPNNPPQVEVGDPLTPPVDTSDLFSEDDLITDASVAQHESNIQTTAKAETPVNLFNSTPPAEDKSETPSGTISLEQLDQMTAEQIVDTFWPGQERLKTKPISFLKMQAKASFGK